MNTTEKRRCAAGMLCMLLLTGCGEYKPGTLRGNVYRNAKAGFIIETPEAFKITAEADYQAWDIYKDAVQQAEERDALEGFVCEYAAQSTGCELLICSEPNTCEDSETAFMARICNRLRDEESGFEVRDLRQPAYGGAAFKSATLAAHAHSLMPEQAHDHSHADEGGYADQVFICVTEADDSFVYLLMEIHDRAGAEDQKQMLLDSIHKT